MPGTSWKGVMALWLCWEEWLGVKLTPAVLGSIRFNDHSPVVASEQRQTFYFSLLSVGIRKQSGEKE